MPGLLTTHVLDTMRGLPAADLQIQLWRLTSPDGARELLKVTYTNSNGRTETPLLQDEELLPGRYELVFAVGNYFAAQQVHLPETPFLDTVPVRFGIADIGAHYHVPLLVSPWAYSTYRGS
jgi:5-hydroxyisourate hydrolase